MKDITKTYFVKHDFDTEIKYPETGIPIHIKIDISWKTAFLIGFIFAACCDLIIHCVK